MKGEPVLYQQKDSLAILTLNRPDTYNALNLEMAKSLAEILIRCNSDQTVKVIIITGSGKAFSAGGDIKHAMTAKEGSAAVFHQLATYVHLAILQIRRMPKPVIAAVNGVAAGGGFSLALAADFRVMANNATFKQAFTSSGLCLDGGMSFFLPRLLGMSKALEIATFDEVISAEQALTWGLATEVVPADQLTIKAEAMAKNILARSLNSFAWSKQLINNSYHTSLESQLETERMGIAKCSAHAEGQEGMRAFLEKRKPNYLEK